MSFFGSLLGGQNKTLDSQIPALTSLSGNLTKSGTSGLNDAMSMFHSILNGDYSSLAPQINSMRKQGSQQLMQLSQFGNRSGGTTATAASMGDRTAAGVNDLIQGARTNATGAAAGIGSTMLNAGLQASNMAVSDSQMQMENYLNSILGQGISGAVSGAEGLGAGAGGKALGLKGF